MKLPFSKALFRYHVTQVKQSAATGIFLCCGWAVGVLLMFVLGQFVAKNEASLAGFFSYLPWVMAIMVPALVMPVATEGVRGVTERLNTLPFGEGQRFVSRYLVYWLLLGIWIVGFWPLAGTVAYLGDPDWGPIFSGFWGSWLLAGGLLGVNLWMVLRAKSAVGGYLGGLGVNLILLFLGTDTVVAWFSAVPGLGWLPGVEAWTPLGVYEAFVAGLVGLSQILYFIGMMVLALGLAMLDGGMRERMRGGATLFLGMLIMVLALSPALRFAEVDVTAENVHTPSKAAGLMVKKLEQPVTFTLYVSENNPDFPPALHAQVDRLEKLFLALREEAPKTVIVKKSNTDASMAAAIGALQAGAEEQVLPAGTTYFAAVTVEMGGKKAVMPKLDMKRAAVMEYDVMSLLASLTRMGTPVVTVVAQDESVATTAWVAALRKTFEVQVLAAANAGGEVPSNTMVLVLPDNAVLPSAAKEMVTRYLGEGGDVVLMADPADAGEGRLSAILPEWGLEIVSGTVVADPDHGTMVTRNDASGAPVALDYPFWMQLGRDNIEDSLAFTEGVRKVFVPESGEVVVLASATATVTPLLSTGLQGRAVSLNTFQTTPPELAKATLPKDARVRKIALMANGMFGAGVTRTANLVVFADRKWLGAEALGQTNDNLALLVNMVNDLGGYGDLTDIRARGAKPRTLVRVEELAKTLGGRTAATEEKIQAKLAQVNVSTGDTAQDAVAAEEAFKLRQQLRDIRQAIRKRLQGMENGLLVMNLLLMPVLLGAAFLWQRRRQRLRATSTL